jgi:NitT/TauT family transport system permease protein
MKPFGTRLAELSGPAMAALQVLLALAVVAAWQFASGRIAPAFFISNPADVAHKLAAWVQDGSIFLHLWVTLCETVLGFVLGSAVGIALGIALGLSRFLSRLLTPFLFVFNALPKPALAPLVVLWFGLGMQSKVVLSAVIVFFIVFFNTFTGVREADRDLIDTVRLMRGTRLQVLTHAIIPSAATWIFAGLQIAVPYALIGAIVAELIAAKAGLGYLIQVAGAQFDTAGVFAALVVIALLAIVLNVVVQVLQSRTQRWKLIDR